MPHYGILPGKIWHLNRPPSIPMEVDGRGEGRKLYICDRKVTFSGEYLYNSPPSPSTNVYISNSFSSKVSSMSEDFNYNITATQLITRIQNQRTVHKIYIQIHEKWRTTPFPNSKFREALGASAFSKANWGLCSKCESSLMTITST